MGYLESLRNGTTKDMVNIVSKLTNGIQTLLCYGFHQMTNH